MTTTIFKNPNCRKIRGNHILEITCAYCKHFIATRYVTKPDKKEAYRLVPSAFNKRLV